MAGQFRDRVCKSLRAGRDANSLRRIEGHDEPSIEDEHAVRNFFHLAECMGSEKKGCTKTAHQVVLNQLAEVSSGKRGEAARRSTGQEKRGLGEQGAREGGAMTHTGGESADLTIEVWSNSHALGSKRDALANLSL